MNENPPKGVPDVSAPTQTGEAYTDPLDIAMYGMARRIRWLSEHRHWYLLHLRSLHRDLEDCGCNGCRLDGVA